MRRQTPIETRLYAYLFPHPTPNDPPTWHIHLARNLVPEVRIEVATFYGDLSTTESRYPGLNYCHGAHRMRLGRFPHHRQLFAAFDALGLTYSEIQNFCCWEGTKWARERYEKDEGIKVQDTTGDEIRPWIDPRHVEASVESRRQSITRKTDISVIVEEAESNLSSSPRQLGASSQDTTHFGFSPDTEARMNAERESSAEALARRAHIQQLQLRRDRSMADQYNRRILTAWELGQPLSADLEQYLKEQIERGDHTVIHSIAPHRPIRGEVPHAIAVTVASQADC